MMWKNSTTIFKDLVILRYGRQCFRISLQQDLSSIRLDVEGMVRLFFILLCNYDFNRYHSFMCVIVVESFGGPWSYIRASEELYPWEYEVSRCDHSSSFDKW